MHLPPLPARLLAVAVLLALSPSPQIAAATATAKAASFELTVTRIPPPELAAAEKRLALAQSRFHAGIGAQEEVEDKTLQRDQLIRRTACLLTVHSNGGPLSAFAAAAADVGGASFSLVNAAAPADLETPLPPFDLHHANWETVVNVLDSFLSAHGLRLQFVGGDSPNPAEATSVVCVLRSAEVAPTAKRPGSRGFGAFQLEDRIFDDQTVDVIVDAIRSAWALEANRDQAALLIKFHPGTKILLISGPAPATEVAAGVIDSLRRIPPRR